MALKAGQVKVNWQCFRNSHEWQPVKPRSSGELWCCPDLAVCPRCLRLRHGRLLTVLHLDGSTSLAPHGSKNNGPIDPIKNLAFVQEVLGTTVLYREDGKG